MSDKQQIPPPPRKSAHRKAKTTPVRGKKAAVSLGNERMRLTQFAVDHAPETILWLDSNGNISYVNEQACRKLGYSRDELLTKKIFEIDTNYTPKIWPQRWQNLRHRRTLTVESQHRTKEGLIFPVEVRASFVEFEGREYNCCYIRDIRERKHAEEALKESEARFRRLTENAKDMIFRLSLLTGKFEYASPASRTIFGFQPDHLYRTRGFLEKIAHPDWIPFCREQWKKMQQGKSSDYLEFKIIHHSGKEKWISLHQSFIRDKSGKPTAVEGIIADITDRKDAEKKFLTEKAYLDQLFDSAQEAIVISDTHHRIIRINEEFSNLFGYSQEEAQGRFIDDLVAPDSRREEAVSYSDVLGQGIKISFESQRKCKDGSLKYVSAIGSPIVVDDRIVAHYSIYRDISARIKAEGDLKASLKEKEVLLNEIHHRVKNNMQIVSSLIRLQSSQIQDRQVADILKESQNRIRSMALIHEKLYQSKDFAQIDFSHYIRDLTSHLFSTYRVDPKIIRLETSADTVFLDMSKAIPCAFILTELVTNSLKHAFPARRKGKITVKMKEIETGKKSLTIRDNGVGFPEDLDFRQTESLGLQLVNTLTRQINGEAVLKREGGTTFEVIF